MLSRRATDQRLRAELASYLRAIPHELREKIISGLRIRAIEHLVISMRKA